MRLRSYLIVLVTCTMAPLAAVVVGVSWLAADSQHSRARVEMQRVADATAGTISLAIGERLLIARALASAPDLTTHSDRVAFERLARSVSAATGLNIIVANRGGEQLVNTWVPEGQPINATPRPDVAEKVIAAGGTYLMPVLPSPRTGEPVAAAVVQTHGPAGEILFVAVRVEPERLAALLPYLALWQDTFTALFDNAGRMAAITPDAPVAARRLAVADRAGVAPVLAGAEAGVLETALAPVGTTGWHVAVGAPSGALAASLRRTTWLLAASGTAGLAGAVLLAILLGRFLLRQARVLVAAASRMDRVVPPLPPSRVRELDLLRVAIENAGAAVRERAEAVAQARLLADGAALLEARVAERTRDLEDAAGRLLNAQDEERRRIARELHDSTVQELIAASMAITQVESALGGAPPTRTSDAIAEARGSLDRATQELRTLSYLLQPPLLDELGLSTAIRVHAEGVARRGGIEVSVTAPEDQPPLPRAVETALFRVMQEGLTNVLRHAKATRATVTLELCDGRIALGVDDDGSAGGASAPADRPEEGAGITGMRARLRQLGGSLEIRFSAAGTSLLAWLPLPEDKSSVDEVARSPS